jgi:raffinose/stachyose/melibiose transport system substrate-binding protein
MMLYRRATTAATTLALAIALTACSSDGTGSESGEEKVTISFFSIAAEDAAVARYDGLIERFQDANPDIKVDVTYPGAEYENLLKTKMAADDLPDVFQTHGWTRDRYAPYLASLTDAPWAGDIAEPMKASVISDDGTVLALPISQNKAGVNVNMAILDEYGIDVPSTWDEFVDAARAIRDASGGAVTPVHIGGADSWTLGAYYNWAAIPAFISPAQNDAAALLDGTFDWPKWDRLSQMLLQFQDEDLLNEDVLTAKYTDSAQLMSEGKVAFAFYGQGVIPEVARLNPEVDIKMFPIPSIEPGDTPTWSGGEADTLAISKNSKHLEAARAFVDFAAQPENLKALIEGTPYESGMNGITTDASSAYTTADAAIRVLPAFDRQYFPNGMWDVMCTNGQELLSGGKTPAQVSQASKTEYDRLRSAAQ